MDSEIDDKRTSMNDCCPCSFSLEEIDKQSEVLSKGRMWHPALVTIEIKKIEMVVQVKCDKTAHLGLNVTNVRNIVHVDLDPVETERNIVHVQVKCDKTAH